MWSVVVVFIRFVPPEKRGEVFAGLHAAVRPGGIPLLEGYRPAQVDYGTGVMSCHAALRTTGS